MLSRTLRPLAALSLLATGAVHLEQYLGAGYRSIPTIGSLFLLNAIGASLLALALILPIRAVVRGRHGELITGLLAALGASIALASLLALLVSENGTLFGFHEPGSGAAIVAAIVAESATLLTSVPLAGLHLHRWLAGGERPRSATTWTSRPTHT
jgi:hypothetical protein